MNGSSGQSHQGQTSTETGTSGESLNTIPMARDNLQIIGAPISEVSDAKGKLIWTINS